MRAWSSWVFPPVLPLALAIACSSCGDSVGPSQPSRVSAEVSPHVGTVLKVRWSTAGRTIGHVEYGVTRSLGMHTPIEAVPAKEHSATLLGLRLDTEVFYRVVTWENSQSGPAAGTSGISKIRTAPPPVGGLPKLTATGSGQTGFVVTPLLGATKAVVILDSDGEIVWYRCFGKTAEGQPDCTTQEVPAADRLEAYRARISKDGRSVVYNYAKISGDPSPNSEIVRVSLDGSEVKSFPVPFLAHDFVEHDDGTLAALVFEDRLLDGARLRGNRILEIAPDGTERTVWTSWNCFDPTTIKGDDPTLGWTFANALDLDPAADAYYVGLRNFSSIAKVNRASGMCEWVLGVGAATVTIADGSARFLHQHQFHLQADRILVMDNDGMGGQMSRLLEYQVDLAAMQARQVWSYLPSPSVYTFVLGEPIRLPDGGVFVNWSAAGQMERLDATGQSLWKVNSNAGVVFGFHTLATDLYAAGGGTVAASVHTAGGP